MPKPLLQRLPVDRNGTFEVVDDAGVNGDNRLTRQGQGNQKRSGTQAYSGNHEQTPMNRIDPDGSFVKSGTLVSLLRTSRLCGSYGSLFAALIPSS